MAYVSPSATAPGRIAAARWPAMLAALVLAILIAAPQLGLPSYLLALAIEIFIFSIRNRTKSIGIKWKQGKDTHDDDFHDNPRPSFYKALEALAPTLRTLCELPEGDLKKITVTGVTCTEDGDNLRAVVVGRKEIKRGNKCLNLNSSILPLWEDDENANATHMTEAEAKTI